MDTIKTVESIHDKAMDLAEEAFKAKLQGDEQTFIELSARALEFELEAANRFKDANVEPTRSILYRSAASLAYNARDFQTAEKLANIGLSGNPPVSVLNELKELLAQIALQISSKKNKSK